MTLQVSGRRNEQYRPASFAGPRTRPLVPRSPPSTPHSPFLVPRSLGPGSWVPWSLEAANTGRRSIYIQTDIIRAQKVTIYSPKHLKNGPYMVPKPLKMGLYMCRNHEKCDHI